MMAAAPRVAHQRIASNLEFHLRRRARRATSRSGGSTGRSASRSPTTLATGPNRSWRWSTWTSIRIGLPSMRSISSAEAVGREGDDVRATRASGLDIIAGGSRSRCRRADVRGRHRSLAAGRNARFGDVGAADCSPTATCDPARDRARSAHWTSSSRKIRRPDIASRRQACRHRLLSTGDAMRLQARPPSSPAQRRASGSASPRPSRARARGSRCSTSSSGRRKPRPRRSAMARSRSHATSPDGRMSSAP